MFSEILEQLSELKKEHEILSNRVSLLEKENLFLKEQIEGTKSHTQTVEKILLNNELPNNPENVSQSSTIKHHRKFTLNLPKKAVSADHYKDMRALFSQSDY